MLEKVSEIPPFDILHPIDADEARCIAAARALIGEDVGKGLAEIRRLVAISGTVCEVHNRLVEEHEAEHCASPRKEHIATYRSWPGMAEAEAAADDACNAEYYAIRYVWKLPVRSTADAVAKAIFAMEYADQADTNEDFQADALRQIADFLAPQELLQAAE